MTNGDTLSCPIKLPPLDSYILPETAASVRTPDTARNVGIPPARSFEAVLSGIQSPPTGGRSPLESGNSIEEAVTTFESFLLALVFKQAFNSRLSSGLFGDSYASKMYIEMFIDAAAEEACKTSPLGIADMLESDINMRGEIKENKDNSDATEELQTMRQDGESPVTGTLSNLL